MSVFFLKKYEDHLNLRDTEFKPIIDLFTDMLMIDVYFFCGMINAKIIPSEDVIEFTKTEMIMFSKELENNKLKLSKSNKKDKKLLVDHYNNLLDLPIEGGYIEKIWDALEIIDITLGDVVLLFSMIRGKILANLEGCVNMLKAISIVMSDELKRRESNKQLLS